MIRIGIVGTGSTIGIAEQHIKAFKRMQQVKITALYDKFPERAEKYINKFDLKDTKVCGSYEELLRESDAVVICTPNHTHVDLCATALKMGKHILCEKPLAVSGAEAAMLDSLADMSAGVSMVGFCYRGIPALRFIKKLIDDGQMGDIFYLRQAQGGNRIADPNVKLEWRMQNALSGPGAIADFGSHMMDIADWLLTDAYGRICEVQAMEGSFIEQRPSIETGEMMPITNEDVAVWNARCEKGVLLSFTASRIGCSTMLELYGSGGYVRYDADDPFHILWMKKEHKGGYSGPLEKVEVPEEIYWEGPETPKIPFEINFYHQAVEFVQAIQNGKTYETNIKRGIYIQRLIDSVKLAAKTGGLVRVDFTE